MHKHSLSNIISTLFSDCHHVWLKSCASLGSSAWFSTHPIILSFKMASNMFSSTWRIKLGLPHPTTHGLYGYICNQPIDLTRIHLLRYVHGRKCTTTHDGVKDSFTSNIKHVKFHVLCEQTHVLPMPFF